MLPPWLPDAVSSLINNRLGNWREVASQYEVQLQSTVTWDVIEAILFRLKHARSEIVDVKARPNAAQYARNLWGDAATNIIADLNSVQAAIEDAINNTLAAVPKDPNGFVLAYQYVSDPFAPDFKQLRQVTPAQSLQLRTDLTVVISTIDDFLADLVATPPP